MAAKKAPNSRGRKSQLVDPARQTIIDCVKEGLSYKRACQIAGIGVSTFCSWRREGRDDREANRKSVFRAFLEDIERAEAELIRDTLKTIKRHGERSLAACTWLLERRFPEEWGIGGKELRKAIKEFMIAWAEQKADSEAANVAVTDPPPSARTVG
jgi:transposase